MRKNTKKSSGPHSEGTLHNVGEKCNKEFISVFNVDVRQKEKQKPSQSLQWKQFVSYLQEKPIHQGGKLTSGYFVRGCIDGKRNDKNLKSCCIAIIDIDQSSPPSRKKITKAIKRSKLACIAYSTFTKGRARIVIKTKPYHPGKTDLVEQKAYRAMRKAGLDVPPVHEVKTLSQPWFLPSDGGRGDGWIFASPGKAMSIKGKLKREKSPEKQKKKDGAIDGGMPIESARTLFIEGLKAGTIHEHAKTYAGRLVYYTDQTPNQIYNTLTVLVDQYCTDKAKVKRWRKGEGEKLILGWIEKRVQEEETYLSFEDLKPDKKKIIMNEKSKIIAKGITKERNVSLVCAPPNSGKTALLFFEVAPKLAKLGYKTYYIDADSNASSHGLMYKFAKLKKFYWMNPYVTQEKVTREEFLNVCFENIKPKRAVLIIDTLKKFCDLMKKNEIKEFFQKAKHFASMGGTVIVLSHTNKYPDNEGKWIFEGTNEIESEPDALTYLYRTPKDKMEGRKDYIISLYSDKTRGSVGQISYAVRKLKDYRLSNVDEMIIEADNFVDLQSLYKPIKDRSSISMADVVHCFGRVALNKTIKREDGYILLSVAKKKIAQKLNTTEKRVSFALNDKRYFKRSREKKGAWLIRLGDNVKI